MANISSSLTKALKNISSPSNLLEQLKTTMTFPLPKNGCMQVFFDEMEFLPWDNPDNLVSADMEATVRQVQATILMSVYLIGGPANVINMAVFYKQGLQDRVNLCLFALSLTDGLYLTGAMFLYGEQVYVQYTSKEKYGPISTFMFNNDLDVFIGFGFISPILSAIIATERCLCVLNPLKFQRLLRARTMAIMILAVYGVVLGLFSIVVTRYRIGCLYDPVSNVAVTKFVEGDFYKAHKKLVNYVDSVFFGVGMPGTVMLVVMTTTLITIIKLRQIAKWRSDTTTTTTSSTISAREIALTKMLVGNSLLFIVCYTPEAMNHLSRIFVPEMNSAGRYHNFYLMALWLGDISIFFNATLNIFVYYTMGSRYRETLRGLFGMKAKSEVNSSMGRDTEQRSLERKSNQV